MENRRTKIVINPDFQYKESLLLVALAVVLVNSFLIIKVLFPGESPLVFTFPTALTIAAVELLLIVGTWYASLKLSHRIAGPIFVLNREIGKLGSGDLSGQIQLRDNDMFQEEAQSINASLQGLRKRVIGAQETSEKLLKIHAEGGDISGLAAQLDAELSGFNTGEG